MDIAFDMFIETEVPEDEVIVSRTDLKGVITYVNETFAKISGYAPEELIGREGDSVRAVMYLPVETCEKLKKRADAEETGVEKLIDRLC